MSYLLGIAPAAGEGDRFDTRGQALTFRWQSATVTGGLQYPVKFVHISVCVCVCECVCTGKRSVKYHSQKILAKSPISHQRWQYTNNEINHRDNVKIIIACACRQACTCACVGKNNNAMCVHYTFVMNCLETKSETEFPEVEEEEEKVE